jgi:hypothetical protein
MAGRRSQADAAAVLATLGLSTALAAGWLATGNASAPDAGLQQIDLLMLHEQVPGLDAVDRRPTMVVVTRADCPDADAPRRLDQRFGLVVSTDADLARRLALPDAAQRCSPGYALLAADGTVRYRTYDPGWPLHDEEQEILLEAVEDGHR